jgi:subtilase family serine protease
VAIVDAYNDPNALSDLTTYRRYWGLPTLNISGGPTFTEVKQTSGFRQPSSNVGWSEEISVDLDMVSAICPNCNILLVEAYSPTFANLGAAENTAAGYKPVSIGNSYGGGESSSETSLDGYYNHPGIAITAATGDEGYGVEYPAASPYVVAVGGTTLTQAASGSRSWTETAWSGAGSGCSAVEAQPTWQSSVLAISGNGPGQGACSKRAVADVSAVADPNTGVAVYDSYGLSGWTVFGGTSVATQIIAAVYGLAGKSTSWTSTNPPASYLYGAPSNDFYPVTSGTNGSCGTDLCNAVPGWDGPTGLGTPDGTGAF